MRRMDAALLAVGIVFVLLSFLVSSWKLTLRIPGMLPAVKLPSLDFGWVVRRNRPQDTSEALLPTATPFIENSIYPSALIIPKLGINSPVDPVGRTDKGYMDVPRDASHVAWFMEGPTPSVRGNAVITGHYDTPSGRPAIFYRLNKLVKGDAIVVVLADGSRHEFVVTGKDVIPYDIFPSDYVFASKYGMNLNLITCNGIWDKEDKIYDKRLVIYATLKGSQFNTF